MKKHILFSLHLLAALSTLISAPLFAFFGTPREDGMGAFGAAAWLYIFGVISWICYLILRGLHKK